MINYGVLTNICNNILAPIALGIIIGKIIKIRSKKCTHDFVLISKDVVDRDINGGIEHNRYAITLNCKRCGQTRIIDTKGDINVYE